MGIRRAYSRLTPLGRAVWGPGTRKELWTVALEWNWEPGEGSSLLAGDIYSFYWVSALLSINSEWAFYYLLMNSIIILLFECVKWENICEKTLLIVKQYAFLKRETEEERDLYRSGVSNLPTHSDHLGSFYNAHPWTLVSLFFWMIICTLELGGEGICIQKVLWAVLAFENY